MKKRFIPADNNYSALIVEAIDELTDTVQVCDPPMLTWQAQPKLINEPLAQNKKPFLKLERFL